MSCRLGHLNRSPGESAFPDIDTANLSPTRQKIISLAKTEFKAQSAGTKFSQGAEEAWCANFVSWIMYQAGAPLKNPHTGGWRIPGTFTLREYYEAASRFKPANSGYQPLPGDAAIYRNSPVFGDHANIVLRNDNGVLTTVGGNEANRIRVFVNQDIYRLRKKNPPSAQAATMLTIVIFQNISGSSEPGTGTFIPNKPAIIVGIVKATVITVNKRIVSFNRVSITAR
jgi:hypothetical protein cdivTM_12329